MKYVEGSQLCEESDVAGFAYENKPEMQKLKRNRQTDQLNKARDKSSG